MKKAGNFLDKFQKLAPPNDALRRAVMDAVKDVVGATLTKANVKIYNSTAFIDASTILKHKIRTVRREILDLIHDKIPKSRDLVRDIR